jgi:uncharacterized membrane protein
MAAFLRLYQLPAESIWYDEAFSVDLAKQTLLDNIGNLENNHPPLYQIILYFWIRVFGCGEFVVRLPSVVFSCISIYLIYKVAAELFNKNTGLVSAFLFGISTFQIHYAQEARSYALLCMLSLASFYFFNRLLASGKTKHFVYYGVSALLLLYTHYFGIFVLIAQNIYLLFFRGIYQPLFRKWWLTQLIVLTLFIPWMPQIYKQVFMISDNLSWLKRPRFTTLYDAFGIYISSFAGHRFFLLYIVLFITGFFKLKNVKNESYQRPFFSLRGFDLDNSKEIILLTLWGLCIIIIPLIISYLLRPIFTVRYTIGGSVFFFIMTAKGIMNFRKTFLLPLLLIVVLALNVVCVAKYYDAFVKPPWREISDYIENNLESDDVVCVCDRPDTYPLKYYLGERSDKIVLLNGIVDKDSFNSLIFPALSDGGGDMCCFILQGSSPVKEKYIVDNTGIFLLIDKRQFGYYNLYLLKNVYN